jgi:GT2 family glycosyltransferase
MIEFMDSQPDVGLAGTRIANPDGSFQSSVEKRYPGEKYAKHELNGLKGDIAWVLGASMIALRDTVEDLGGFDERFFLYGEDLDLCLRLRKAGWAIGYIPDTIIVHWGGQSERNNLPVEIWEKKIKAESIFYEKHYTKRAVRAIRRANLFQALWRILTLKLTLPFCADKATSLNKLDKYKVVLKTFHLKTS